MLATLIFPLLYAQERFLDHHIARAASKLPTAAEVISKNRLFFYAKSPAIKDSSYRRRPYAAARLKMLPGKSFGNGASSSGECDRRQSCGRRIEHGRCDKTRLGNTPYALVP
jgi:hypothetical protein